MLCFSPRCFHFTDEKAGSWKETFSQGSVTQQGRKPWRLQSRHPRTGSALGFPEFCSVLSGFAEGDVSAALFLNDFPSAL